LPRTRNIKDGIKVLQEVMKDEETQQPSLRARNSKRPVIKPLHGADPQKRKAQARSAASRKRRPSQGPR
jgi:hypothetical protein